jgi:transcriptional regulator with XRE-family HTH domain
MNSEQEILNTIGSRIKKIRDEKDLSQMDVAYKAEMSMSHLSKIEHGRHVPGLLVLIRIAVALQVKFSALTKDIDSYT